MNSSSKANINFRTPGRVNLYTFFKTASHDLRATEFRFHAFLDTLFSCIIYSSTRFLDIYIDILWLWPAIVPTITLFQYVNNFSIIL